MPLRTNIGISRKVADNNYGSRGASVNLEVELDSTLINDPERCPDVLGAFDLIVDTGSELVVSDWKTARSRWSREQAEDAAEQLILYSELAKDFAPGKPVKLEFIILTKAKEPIVDRHLMPVDPAQATRTKRVVERVWRAIESGNFYPAPTRDELSWLCTARPDPC